MNSSQIGDLLAVDRVVQLGDIFIARKSAVEGYWDSNDGAMSFATTISSKLSRSGIQHTIIDRGQDTRYNQEWVEFKVSSIQEFLDFRDQRC